MYMPAHFAETRSEVLRDFLQAHPFATLVTLNGGALNANPLPVEYDPGAGELGTLRAHVARANPVWKDLDAGVEALVIFQGPHAYVSPSHYPAKAEHGKVVPTYNYMTVHAYGPLTVHEDADWLTGLVGRLSDRFEAGRAQPWALADAPADYIATLARAIVGLEIPVTKLLGKWKVSQNKSAADMAGVMQGMRSEGQPALAQALEERARR